MKCKKCGTAIITGKRVFMGVELSLPKCPKCKPDPKGVNHDT